MQPKHVYRGHLDPIRAVAITPAGGVAASAADDRTIRLWKSTSTDEVARFVLPEQPLGCLALSDDGKQVAACIKGELLIFGRDRDKPAIRAALGDDVPVVMHFLPDGDVLFVGMANGRLRSFDLTKGQWLHDAVAHDGAVGAILSSADGATLYSGGADGVVQSWDPSTLAQIAVIDKGYAPILSLGLTARGQHLGIGDQSGKIAVYDLAEKRRSHEVLDAYPVRAVAVSDDVNEIAALEGADRQTYHTWTGQRYNFVMPLSFPNDSAAVAMSRDGRLVGRTTMAGVRVWEVQDSKSSRELPTSSGDYEQCLAFSPSRRYLAVGGKGLCVWDLNSAKRLFEIPVEQTGELRQILFSPDERFVTAFNGQQDSIKIWSAAVGEAISQMTFAKPYFFQHVYFSADSRLLLVLNSPAEFPGQPVESKFDVWEIATGNPLGEVPLPCEHGVAAIALSPDDRELAIGFRSGLIWICDFAALAKQSLPGLAADPRDKTDLNALFAALGSAEPAIAYRSMAQLAAQPDATIALLAAKLPDIADVGASSGEPTELIRQLESEDLATRRDASTNLRRLGVAARLAMEQALKASPSPAKKARLELLLSAQSAPPDSRPLTVIRAIQVLERIASSAAVAQLHALAKKTVDPCLKSECESALGRLSKASSAGQ